MSSTRYKLQRYKFQKYPTGVVDINLWRHGEETEQFCKKRVEVVGGVCNEPGNYVYIKYLSSEGKYKFIPFVRSIALQQTDSEIGQMSTLVTSLKGPNTGTASMGFTTRKQMVLTTPVNYEQYLTYEDVLSSSRVYLQKDTIDLKDGEENWILVDVTGGNSYNIRKPKDVFTITITLPEYNNIRV